MPILLGDSLSTNRKLLEQSIHDINLDVRPKYEVMQAQTAISIAMAGLAVAILQKSALPTKSRPGMQILHIVNPTISWQFGIVTLATRELTPAAKRLTELISSFYKARFKARPRLGPQCPATASAVGSF
jgi:DNA-binding transcriptional LysR family regulator